jgi:hypothetical protein
MLRRSAETVPTVSYGPGASGAVEVPETSLAAPPGDRFEPNPPARLDAANGGSTCRQPQASRHS